MRWDRFAVAMGTVLFLDALRVFLPSLITLFGRAGETSPELMGLYALAWFLAPLPFVVLHHRLDPARTALVTAAVLAGGRVALQATDGGGPQLYLSSLLVGVGAVWLVTTAMATVDDPRFSGHGVMVGVVTGIAATAVIHTLLNTVDLVWRDGVLPWIGVLVQIGLFAWALFGAWRHDTGGSGPRPASALAWLALGPLLFLSGLYTANPAVGEVIGDSPVAAALVTTTAVLSVMVAADPRWFTGHPVLPFVLLTGSLIVLWASPTEVGGVPGVWPSWALMALVIGQIGLAGCAGWAVHGAVRAGRAATGRAAFGGLFLLVVLVFAFYASYDLHYDNALVSFLALIPIVFAMTGRGPAPDRGGRPWLTAGAAAFALIATVTAPSLHTGFHVERERVRDPDPGLRVAAYNVRMGFGMDGRYALHDQIELLDEDFPDIVVLSEVDRGWLLNGGHEALSLMAERLGMRAYWAPADGPLWGDAILTSREVIEVRGHTLTPSGPTGAQALEIVLPWEDGTRVSVIATHVQPETYDFTAESSREQLRDLAGLVTAARAEGRPVVLAGDLNIEPENPAWSILTDAGLHDPFERPFNTIPSLAGPPQEIDHILVTSEFSAENPENRDVPYSDHRMISVALELD
ncbi:endonuclease/exonuclease/phosphatase family protein [Nocardiopsis lambiniae]|uniref:Endonuclease/exonuclease/phosphatase family protein n=1 Tax=Nocardiopsis lambiniae TaxID=3075539 RepID=A0ABU2M614_9ACTN|nr:endonuclease/exonuclease/phosphatase family protein [Nocardiopsis sp. DSM 44743]MDT0328018.1 endonuclease/exonuclease/phosphatase family protein [Nocardiopsis sp. DSM 44743]